MMCPMRIILLIGLMIAALPAAAQQGTAPNTLTPAEQNEVNGVIRNEQAATGAIGLQSAHPEDPAGAFIEFRSLKIKRLK